MRTIARPAKPANLLKYGSSSVDETKQRAHEEKKLRGGTDKVKPPSYLNAKQKRIFRYIVNELEASGIIGNLDIYLLSTASIAIDRLQEIETMINQDIELLKDRTLMASKEKYSKEFFRAMNELSLSPQSRAKLGNINVQATQANADPVLQALKRIK